MHDLRHPHRHDDEDHEGDPHAPPDESDPIWDQERIELRSVGIDIGSSTSHLTFSRLTLRRLGFALSSRFAVVRREVIHQSSILLTPYRDPVTIDTERLGAFIHDAYVAAGVRPEAIDTGAVVVTGEAAKKENAEVISSLFARESGKFVCAVAGPVLEAIMAAHGAGAVERSREKGPVLNVDIGGGTTKFALCRDGEVVDTAVVNVGGRLVAHDAGGKITRLEEPAQWIAESTGLPLEVGITLTDDGRRALVEGMVESFFELLDRRPLSPLTRRLMHTPPLSNTGPIRALSFSGGVSEYLYGDETREFGDLGKALAEAIRRRLEGHPLGALFVRPTEGIRATVIGAAQYTVQVSGNTIFCSRPDLLPARNLPVVAPRLSLPLTPERVATAVRQALDHHELADGPLAFAIRWPFGPDHASLAAFGRGLLAALDQRPPHPIAVVFDTDIARLVGQLLAEELGTKRDIIALDGLELAPFDYIDLGELLRPAGVVPVVIKSLVFRPSPRDGASKLGTRGSER